MPKKMSSSSRSRRRIPKKTPIPKFRPAATPQQGSPDGASKNLGVAVATASTGGRILAADERFAQFLGPVARRSIIGSNLGEFVSAASWPALAEALRAGASHPSTGELTVTHSGLDGQRTIRLSFYPSANGNRKAVSILAVDISEVTAAAAELAEARASITSMSSRFMKLQDEERRRMARDLHDMTGQELAVAIVSLDHLSKNLSAPRPELEKGLSETTELLRKVESEIRTLSYVLHPPLLDDTGLASALQWFIEGFSKRTGIQISLEVPDDFPRCPIEKETALFRVIQEALTNVYRHSGSSDARVKVWADNSSLHASVEDHGKGFDTRHSEGGVKSGVGIQSMRGRLDLFRGALDVHSGRNGTRVTATIPLESGEAELLRLNEPSFSSPAHSPAHAAQSSRRRILIADDHEIARRGIKDLFREENDFEICGEAKDGLDALRMASELRPDLVILDLNMPEMGGLSVVHELHKRDLGSKVLVYTNHYFTAMERWVRSSGCDGLVLKSNASHHLIRAARTILRDNSFYSSEAAGARLA